MTATRQATISTRRAGLERQAPCTGDPRVVVAMHEGFYGARSGTGFSNRAFLIALSRLLPAGRLAVLPTQVPRCRPYFDPQWATALQRQLDAAGADVVTLPPPPNDLAVSPAGRDTVCRLATQQAADIAQDAQRCLLIGLDAPFLGIARHAKGSMDLLAVPRTTSYVTAPRDRALFRREREDFRAIAGRGDHVAVISSFMRRHLRLAYGVPGHTMLDLPNGLLLDDPYDRQPRHSSLPSPALSGFMLAMGRAVPEKGFEDLLTALKLLRRRQVQLPHLILAATEPGRNPTRYQQRLARLVDASGLDGTLVTQFDPRIRGLLSHHALRAVIVPSREEPFGRIPLEAFAAQAAPVVATTAGGLAHTVVDGLTGISAAPNDPESLASAIHRALLIPPSERRRLQDAGMQLLRTRHDYAAAIGTALSRCAPWALSSVAKQEGRV